MRVNPDVCLSGPIRSLFLLFQNQNRSGRRVRPPPYRVAAVAERRTTGGLAFGSRSERTKTLSLHTQCVTSKSFGPFGCVRKKIVRKFWVQKIRTPFGHFLTVFHSSEPEIAAQRNLERSQIAQRLEVLDQERPTGSAPEASRSLSVVKGLAGQIFVRGRLERCVPLLGGGMSITDELPSLRPDHPFPAFVLDQLIRG